MNTPALPARLITFALVLCGATGALAQNWSHRDIGSVGKTGSWTLNTTTQAHSVKGAGADIWGTADGFHFVYQALSGDGEIVARVASQSNTNAWAKAGVMIRETVNANSRHAMMVVTPGNGASFQRRTSTGGSSASTTVAGPRAPYWVRIVRSGSTFSGYRSDGSSWVLVGTATVSMAANVQVGLAVTSHTTATLSIAVFDNVTISQIRRPSVVATSPANGATNVFRNTAINADVSLPNVGAGVDDTTLNGNVQLTRTSGGVVVPGGANTSGGGDAIVFQPASLLDPSTNYTFKVTAGVKDLGGAAFLPFTMTFTTGTTTGVVTDPRVRWNKTLAYSGAAVTSLVIGADGKLYGAALDGVLRRWTIGANGTLSNLETFNGLARRAIIGIVFDPLVPNTLWLSHNDEVYVQPATEFTGKVSRLTLSGTSFTGVLEDYVVHFPRSAKDHLSNSLAFGPDGFLYMNQGSLSAMGAPDSAWYNRAERLLSGAVLKIDPRRTTGLPIDVQTAAFGGNPGGYNPFAVGAPVTIFGWGVRNAYDLVWHSNGRLYVPTNGSAAGGNTPASPAGVTPAVPALTNVATQDDYLFLVEAGGYYGHPNVLRNQYVLNGGNPTAATDPAEVITVGSNPGYPVGVQPDANYRGFAWNFGRNRSPDGAIEYRSATFGGALTGRLLVCEYSGGDDIIALAPGPDGKIPANGITQVVAGLQDPLDLVEDVRNGSIYVAEFFNGGTSGQISLLTPAP